MVTILVDLSLSNSDMYEHIFLGNINKLCKTAGKYDVQQKYKTIINSGMVTTPE